MKPILISFLFLSINLAAQEEVAKIGELYWTTENLDVDRFSNGDIIPEAKTIQEWQRYLSNRAPAWCYYGFSPEMQKVCGKLYNWYAIQDLRGLAPDGFHIPYHYEWMELYNALGSNNAKLLKSTTGWEEWETGGPKKVTCSNCIEWSSAYISKVACHVCKDTRKMIVNDPIVKHTGTGNNSIGFRALPCGFLNKFYYDFRNNSNNNEEFRGVLNEARWWSILQSDDDGFAWMRSDNENINPISEGGSHDYGFSVRLIRNSEELIRFKQSIDSLVAINKFEDGYKLFETEFKARRIKEMDAVKFYTAWNDSFTLYLEKLISDKSLDDAMILVDFYEKKELSKNLGAVQKGRTDSEKNQIAKWKESVAIIKHNIKISELKLKPLSELEKAFVGKWKFDSKNIYLVNGEIVTMEEDWLVNSDRTYSYESRFQKFLEKSYFNEYKEKGVFEIEQDSFGDMYVVAYELEEQGKSSSRVDKMKFDKIDAKKSSRTINFNDAKYPVKLKGKKE